MRTESNQDLQTRRAALKDAIPVMILGFVALALGSQPSSGTTEKLWFGLAIGFVCAIAWIIWRAFRRADEYQQRIQLEGMAVGFAFVVIALQIASLLDAMGVGSLKVAQQLIIAGGVLTWLLVAAIRHRQTR